MLTIKFDKETKEVEDNEAMLHKALLKECSLNLHNEDDVVKANLKTFA